MERLEPRLLLSAASAGSEFRVNSTTSNIQISNTTGQGGSIAMAADGDFVIAWSSQSQDGSGYGVYAQRYDAAGQAQGTEFQVNTFTAGNQRFATVAMDADGDFVVTWSSSGQDGNADGIYAQRYNSAGVAQGSEFQVNTTTQGEQTRSQVAIDRDGNFVITWSTYGQDGASWGVYARRYNAAGVAQSDEFQVNTSTASIQNGAAVAMDATGDFVITWTSYDGGVEIFAQRYNSAGEAQGGEFRVNSTTQFSQSVSTVAMDTDGDFVVTWTSYGQDGSFQGIIAQRYNAAGIAQGTEFQVNTTATGSQINSSVAMDSDGDFVVTWESNGQDGSLEGVYAQAFSAAGQAIGTEFQVNTNTVNGQRLASVEMDQEGSFVITWSSRNQDGGSWGIYAQRYEESADTAGPMVTGVLNGDHPLIDGAVQISAVPALTVVFSEDLNVTGGTAGANSVTNPANWILTRNGVDVSGTITGVTFGFNVTSHKYEAVLSLSTALEDGRFELTIGDAIQDLAGNALDGDLDGTPGGNSTFAFITANVTTAGGEFRVNTSTDNQQTTGLLGLGGSIAMDDEGDFVVVWSSNGQDGSLYGVYAQRYNAAGAAQGTEFQVNTTVTNDQKYAVVSMDADGDFVVVWASNGQDGSLYGIYAQRYDATGIAQGSEFRVNTTTAGNQSAPSVAMDADGDFVITWTSMDQDGSGTGIYSQRYDAAGNAQGTEFLVNTTTVNNQSLSTVAMDAAGSFVVTWRSSVQDGSGAGIYAQRYSAAGIALGIEFLVNTTTASNQTHPTVAMDSQGNFVVTWASDGQDGSGYGVYGQRYNASGVAQGNEFQVNSDTTNDQRMSVVAMDSDGDYIVTWTSTEQDGSSYGIYAQRYNSAGVPQGDEFRINSTTADFQYLPSIAMSPDGDFVVVWTSNGQDGSGTGVYGQRYESNLTPTLAGPGSISSLENDPATAIAPGITVSDLDSPTLNSASITITNFVAGQDLLAFVNDGASMGNIAVAANLDGVLTLTSAGASATLAEWQAALRAVTYENASDNPDSTQRSVQFAVSDASDSSNTLTSTIDITAVNDTPILADLESSSLRYVPGGAATAITSTLTATDHDSANLTGAVITISSGYQTGDVLTFVDTPNITGVFDAGTGTLTLSGTDSVASYQTALRSVLYVSSSTNAAPRTVSFEVTDGTAPSGSLSRTVGGYAQLSGSIINVYGTPLVDVITVTDSGALQFVVNGQVTDFDSSQVTAINIFAYSGNDTVQINSLTIGKTVIVYGGGGNDTLRADSSVISGVLLNGGDGNDLIVSGSGNDVLIGGAGNDWLNGGDGSDTLEGGTGNDVFAFSAATGNQTDTVIELSEGGTDLLNFSTMTTGVTANLTSDTALATMVQRIVKTGSAGQSTWIENIFGGSSADFLTGNAAKNDLYGNNGNDTLIAGDGNDYMDGGDGNDLLKGGNQDDVLIGGIGSDSLMGESGNDRLNGGDGANTLDGGQGDDRYIFTAASANQIDTVVELIDGGIDTLDFSALTTAVTINLASDLALASMAQRIVNVGLAGQSANFENALGGSGNDQISGNSTNNLLVGNEGNDIISGGSGNDILLGRQGNDTLKGISGRNLLLGGTGGDLLQGGTDGDLLLSGFSSYESDPAILQALLTEWASENTYQSRVDHLLGTTGGGANTSFTLNSSTVTNDENKDYLTGNTDQDWFLASSQQDVLTDKSVNEIFTQIDSWI